MVTRNGKSSRRRRGIALLITTAMSIVIIPMIGLSVDTGILYVVKTRLSSAADAAALAGARSLSRGADLASQTVSAQTTAQNYFRANFPSGYFMTASSSIATTVSQSGANARIVATSATAQVPLFFIRVLLARFLPTAGSTVTVAVSATALRRDSNVILVLDRSASLALSGSCGTMKSAAAGFVNQFSEQKDYLGLATFANSSHYLDYPVATNFKTSNPSIVQIINNITCVGGTNSATGLMNGYKALATLNEPGALNVIVFFTDGNPTALYGTFPIKASSPCTNKADRNAVLTMTTAPSAYGLLNLSNGVVPISNDNATIVGDSTCRFTTNGATQVATDIKWVPTADFYGNNTNSGYKSVTGDGTGHIATDATSIKNASINAAESAATRIRNGVNIAGVGSLAGVVIFSIGLGNVATDLPDAAFLKRVANDPGSAIYDPTKLEGLYVFAQSASDLNDAFKRVSAEILRLAK